MFFKKKKNKAKIEQPVRTVTKKLSKEERKKQNIKNIPKQKESNITLRHNPKMIIKNNNSCKKSISEMTLEEIYNEISSLEPEYVTSTLSDEDVSENFTINVSDVLKSIACAKRRSNNNSLIYKDAEIAESSIERLKWYGITVKRDESENNSHSIQIFW